MAVEPVPVASLLPPNAVRYSPTAFIMPIATAPVFSPTGSTYCRSHSPAVFALMPIATELLLSFAVRPSCRECILICLRFSARLPTAPVFSALLLMPKAMDDIPLAAACTPKAVAPTFVAVLCSPLPWLLRQSHPYDPRLQ